MHLISLRRLIFTGATLLTLLLMALLSLLTFVYSTPTLYAQGESALILTVDLENAPTTVKPGDIITQRIQLGYEGIANTDAVFIQEIPSGLRPISVPVVSELQPQTVTPLTVERRGGSWGWKGKMKPGAFLVVVVPFRVPQCYGEDRQTALTVNARQTPDGQVISDTVPFTVDCTNQSIADIHVEDKIIYADGSESAGSNGTITAASVEAFNALGRFYVPGAGSSLRLTLRNDGTSPLTIGTSGAATCCRCLTCTVAADLYSTELAAATDTTFRRFMLQPGESQVLEVPMSGAPVVNDPGDTGKYTYGGEIAYCLLTGEERACPDPTSNPQLAATHLIDIPVRASDLGDAPDSTNHTAGAAGAMAAYTGVPATFPTVFDPATGADQGPRHRYPQFLHLGQRVSREAEADIGPDQDPLNNIVPATNNANNERGDDGVNVAAISLSHCADTTVPVRIYVSPAAVNWFQQQGTMAYLNGWLDFTRDGDWADVVSCQDSANQTKVALEHIVIDHAVDVVALGAGLHTINVSTGIVHWPAAEADAPAWLRFSLSERQANKPLNANGLNFGDGRGFAQPFGTGETEDYLLRGSVVGAPDVDVRLDGVLEERTVPAELSAAQNSSVVVDFRVRYRIDYSNRGEGTANNALLEFQIPEKLQGSQPAFVRAPGIAASKIQIGATSIRFGLPSLDFGGFGTIVVGWTGCLTCTLQVATTDLALPSADFDASANVTLANDGNSENNSATIRPRREIIGAGIGGFYTENTAALRRQGVTCQDTVTFAGRGRPGSSFLLQIDSLSPQTVSAAEVSSSALAKHFDSLKVPVTVDANGNWRYTLSDLHDGSYSARALMSSDGETVSAADVAAATFDRGFLFPPVYVTIDPSLTVDPMSFQLVDAQGRKYFPPVDNRLGNFEIQDFMVRGGGEYTASAIACPNQVIESLQFKVGDLLVDAAPAADDCEPKGSDQCGPWSAKVTIPGVAKMNGVAVADGGTSFEVIATTASADNTFAGTLITGEPGTVTNATGALVDGAAVTLFQATTTSSTDSDGNEVTSSFFVPWVGADYGQENPLTTAGDGTYSFVAPTGRYQLLVEHSGYQSYLTAAFDHVEGALIAENITLSAQISEEADYVVEVSEEGFVPATLTVAPGAVVAFVNVDFAAHASRGTIWDSGLLTSGGLYKVQFSEQGTYLYSDSANPMSAGAIIVDEAAPTAENQIFLPVVVR